MGAPVLAAGPLTLVVRAGLDVFAQEPAGATGEFTSEIAQTPAIYGTHHIGAFMIDLRVDLVDERPVLGGKVDAGVAI